MASCSTASDSAAVPAQDVQSGFDHRAVPLTRAGVRGVRYPVRILDAAGAARTVVATWSLTAALAAERRGVHMSRFVECLRELSAPLAPADWPALQARVRERLDAPDARVEAAFPLVQERRAPATGLAAAAVYDVSVQVAGPDGGEALSLGVRVPVATLCPCSKAISDYGAHNQRGEVWLEIGPARDGAGRFAVVWPEEMIESAEAAASAPVFPLLKRPDEKAITMRAFDRPAFVEDVARDLIAHWRADPRAARLRVEVASLESIHAHDAFAAAEWARGQ